MLGKCPNFIFFKFWGEGGEEFFFLFSFVPNMFPFKFPMGSHQVPNMFTEGGSSRLLVHFRVHFTCAFVVIKNNAKYQWTKEGF